MPSECGGSLVMYQSKGLHDLTSYLAVMYVNGERSDIYFRFLIQTRDSIYFASLIGTP